jgi:hypothetical protein
MEETEVVVMAVVVVIIITSGSTISGEAVAAGRLRIVRVVGAMMSNQTTRDINSLPTNLKNNHKEHQSTS